MSFGFMQKRAPWVKLAKCVGDQEERWWRMTPQNILDCQDICALCPARKGCGEQALIEEGDVDAVSRYGFRAYMTPAQRTTVHRMGGLQGRDPMLVVTGNEDVPGIPEEGLPWSRHHASLAKRIREYLAEHPRLVSLPSRAQLSRLFACSVPLLTRVLEGLVQDGTLSFAPNSKRRFVRNPNN